MTTLPTIPALRRVGAFAIATGAVFAAAGTAAWCAVTTQLRAEKIVIPPNAPILAGKSVQDPVSAAVEAHVIKGNAERGAGGRTFADISAALREVEPGSDEERKLRSQSASLSTAASLRTALMTSVLAYGVSALVVGLGALFTLTGWQLRRIGRR